MRGDPHMAGDIEKEYRSMTLRASIEGISPSRLWIIRWAVKLASARMRVWRARRRKEKVT